MTTDAESLPKYSENIKGIGALGLEALALYYGTGEAKEGTQAFLEKRRPDFRRRK